MNLDSSQNSQTVSVGDIRQAFPMYPSEEEGTERVLVVGVSDFGATCVLLSLDYGDATHRDIILAPADTNLKYYMVIHTAAVCRIDFSRLSKPIAKLDERLVGEVISCQFGDPTEDFEHGQYLIEGLDAREPYLVQRIRRFRGRYGLQPEEQGTFSLKAHDKANFKAACEEFLAALDSGVDIPSKRTRLEELIQLQVISEGQADLELIANDYPIYELLTGRRDSLPESRELVRE